MNLNTFYIDWTPVFMLDGINWNRKDDVVGSQRSENEFDTNMTCYPNIAELDNMLYMFYNGNRFGQEGFGLASVPLAEI